MDNALQAMTKAAHYTAVTRARNVYKKNYGNSSLAIRLWLPVITYKPFGGGDIPTDIQGPATKPGDAAGNPRSSAGIALASVSFLNLVVLSLYTRSVRY